MGNIFTYRKIDRLDGPQFLLQIGGDRGPIEMVNFPVGEDISQILGAAVCHAHGYDANWDIVLVFEPPKWRFPRRVGNVLATLALKTSGGWVPRVVGQVEEDSSFIIFFLACFASSNGAAFNKGPCSDDAPRERGY